MRIVKITLLLILLLFSLPIVARHDLMLKLETVGVVGSSGYVPFWQTSNLQGLSSVHNNGFVHYAAIGRTPLTNNLFVGYAIDFGLGAGLESNLFVHQLNIDMDYKWLGMSIGKKERWSDKIHYLSSGALTWSGNCQPIPELRIGIPEYARIPILGSWFSVKGHIGYGRLTDDKWRQNHGKGSFTDRILFHSKSAFLRFGDEERFPLKVTLGLEMNSMFGGIKHNDDTECNMPADVGTFWTVLFPFHPVGEQGNEDGDNLGSWHLSFDYELNDWNICAYYEHFYEDHSSMLGIEYKNNMEGKKEFIFYGFRNNWFDGLYGIDLKVPEELRFIREVVFEYLNTKGQSGAICNLGALVEGIDGQDDMYNHGIYDSYSHYGYAIGNPVLISPVYNDDNSARFRSNRVQMFHIGIDGGITNKIDYRFLATSTQHWGCYGAPLKEVERVTSVMLEFSYRMGDAYDWKFTLSGAMDFDSGSGGSYLLGNNRGVMLTVSKCWKVL